VGIAALAAHCVQLLVEDIQKIIYAPEALNSLKKELLSVNQALVSH